MVKSRIIIGVLKNRPMLSIYNIDRGGQDVIFLTERSEGYSRPIMIHFEFQENKFWALMQLLCERIPDLDKLRAVKLLYFIDRECLLSDGAPVLGDRYIAMEFGPVPSRSYDLLKAVENNEITDSSIHIKSPGRYPKYGSTTPPDLKWFSDFEIEVIENIISKYGHLSGIRLSDISHKHKAWTESHRNAPVDYELFFADDLEEHSDAYHAMMLGQEDRDFTSDI